MQVPVRRELKQRILKHLRDENWAQLDNLSRAAARRRSLGCRRLVIEADRKGAAIDDVGLAAGLRPERGLCSWTLLFGMVGAGAEAVALAQLFNDEKKRRMGCYVPSHALQ